MANDNAESTTRDTIYKELRRAIIMGHHHPGERLVVEELANNYGTSVTPVRDALQMLGQDGLVTIKPRSGYFVTHITLKELRDMLELREILEMASVRRAAARITEEQIEQLRHIHAGYTGDDDDSYTRYTDENRLFHYLLAEASGNHELAEALGHLHDRLARFMVMRHGAEVQLHSHATLIDALDAHDVDAACAAMSKELADSYQTIMDRVMQEEAAFWQLGTRKSNEES